MSLNHQRFKGLIPSSSRRVKMESERQSKVTAAPVTPRAGAKLWTNCQQSTFVKPALRRRASDLAGWPEVNRIVHWVELDCETQRLYKGVGTLSKQRAALVKSEAVIPLRQKSSLLKVEDSIELCLELLVAISCEFLLLQRSTAKAKRFATIVERFQLYSDTGLTTN
jgi:hypothetical protein